MPASTPDHFRITRVICTALASGVALFWVASWTVTGGGSQPLSGGGPPLNVLLLVWGAVAIPAFGAALHFRNRAATPASTRRALTEENDSGSGVAAQVATIIAHALLEGPALMAGVVFLLFGTGLMAWVSLPVYALGVLLTWPQREWFSHP